MVVLAGQPIDLKARRQTVGRKPRGNAQSGARNTGPGSEFRRIAVSGYCRPLISKVGGQGIAVNRQERCRKRHGRVGDRNDILLPERVPILRAQRVHRRPRLLHVLARRRMVACILFERADALAGNSGNGIFHGHDGIFMGKEIGEIDAKILPPQRRPDGERRLDEIAEIDIDENSAGAAQLVERSSP